MIRFILLMLFSVHLLADEILLTWTLPEIRDNGSQIEIIDRFNIYQTVNNSSPIIFEVGAALSSFQIPDVSEGNHTFQISTVERYTNSVGENYEVESELSDPITINVLPVVISKPIKMMLTVELIK